MQVNVEKLSPVLVELQVQVPAERVRSELDKAYTSLQRTAKIRGFRPGKAPRDVLTHMYGPRIQADVSQRLVDETFTEALATTNVEPLSTPSFAPGELRPAEPFSYKARFEVRPEIASVHWEGLEVKRTPVNVSDDLVNAELQALRHQHSTLQAPAEERPVQKGDVATMAFTLSVDGVAKQTDTHDVDVDVGEGKMMKELEEGLTGMRVGEEKDIEAVFSSGHPNPDFRNKTALFKVTLKDVRERIFPDLDDELAKDCGEDSLDKLRESVKAKLEKEMKQRADEEVAEQLVLELCKLNPVPVPPSLLDQQAQAAEREYVAAARRSGQRFDNNAEFRAQVRAESEVKTRAGLLMAEIARIKEVTVTDEDMERGYAELAEQSGKNVARVKAEHRDGKKRDTLLGMILEDKILTLLEGAAKVSSS